MFVYISMIMNFDTGVFPPALNYIKKDLNIN